MSSFRFQQYSISRNMFGGKNRPSVVITILNSILVLFLTENALNINLDTFPGIDPSAISQIRSVWAFSSISSLKISIISLFNSKYDFKSVTFALKFQLSASPFKLFSIIANVLVLPHSLQNGSNFLKNPSTLIFFPSKCLKVPH